MKTKFPELPESARAYFSEMGKLGGKNRAAKLTAEERRAISKMGNDKRWAKTRKKARQASARKAAK